MKLNRELSKIIEEGLKDPKVVEVVLKKRGDNTPDCINCGNRNGYNPRVVYMERELEIIYFGRGE